MCWGCEGLRESRGFHQGLDVEGMGFKIWCSRCQRAAWVMGLLGQSIFDDCRTLLVV